MAAVRSITDLQTTSGPLAAVWRGQSLAVRSGPVLASGHAPLDAQLPGGGWPLDALVELLPAQAATPFWQLLLPALSHSMAQARGPVVLVASPHAPFPSSLAAQGLPAERLLCIRADTPAERLWATEQALRCVDVPAVLAWLPLARDDALRRLQLAGAERQRLLFVLRPAQAEAAGSPARLRLALQSSGADLQVRVIKRRGPPCVQTITLPARPARLQSLLDTRAARAAPSVAGAPRRPTVPAPLPLVHAYSHPPLYQPHTRAAGAPSTSTGFAAQVIAHVLDRTAAA